MSRTVQTINVTTGKEEIVTVSDSDMGWTPKTTEENNAFKLNLLRAERNGKLAETDWTQSPDSPLSDSDKTAWATYRQELRDITKTYKSLEDVKWPTAPKG